MSSRVANSPLNLLEQAKQGVTDMVSTQMPNNIYDQLKAVDSIISTKKGQDKLDLLNDFNMETTETGTMSGSDFCHMFPLAQTIRFKYSNQKQFKIVHQKPSCCGSVINGKFQSFRKIIGNQEEEVEDLYTTQYVRKCCRIKWLSIFDFLGGGTICYYCTNCCFKPQSTIVNNQTKEKEYTIQYSGLSFDSYIKDKDGNVKYTLSKKCYEGDWELFDQYNCKIDDFLARKWQKQSIKIQLSSTYILDIQFPQSGIPGKDKMAILYALSLSD